MQPNENIMDMDCIYTENIDDLFGYALSMGFSKQTAMDAIHDVFCKIYQNSAQLLKVENIRFYLFRSLKNKLIDITRINKEHIPIIDENSPSRSYYESTYSGEDELIKTEEKEIIQQKIRKILSVLTVRQKEIIYLRYIMEYSYEEVSLIMNIKENSCRKLVHKTLSILKENNISLFIFLKMFSMLYN